MTKPRIAVYTGVFDPVHLGHLDIIERGSRMYDRLVVGLGINPDKQPLFTVEERLRLLTEVTKPMGNVELMTFSGLAVRFVKQVGASVMLRGLRTVTDMDYEFSMSLTNRSLDPDLETVFLLAMVEYTHLSSTLIRQIAALGGDLRKFLPPSIVAMVEAKVRKRNLVPQEPE